MNIYSVICEYNPFHNGHKFLLDKAKENGATHVVAIMGGHFLQRGDVSIADKWTRTQIALRNGADMVLELPTVFATASAEKFAMGGVQTANALGCVKHLCFGSECGNINQLTELANALEEKHFFSVVKENLSSGISYPSAVQQAANSLLDNRLARVLLSANNTLGLEYIKALKKTDSSILPFTVKRSGVTHDSERTSGEIASASFIRKLIAEERQYTQFLPSKGIEQLQTAFEQGYIGELENGSRALIYALRTKTAQQFSNLPDVTEGLENRLLEAVRKGRSVEEIIEQMKTRRYTYARIRRILFFALLGINKEMYKKPIQYLRVLGFTKKGEEILNLIKKNAAMPIITNVARDIKQLNATQRECFNIDLLATDIYGLFMKKPYTCGLDYTKRIIIEK